MNGAVINGSIGSAITDETTIANQTSVILGGYNDMRYFGNDAAAIADQGAAFRYYTAFLAVPTASWLVYTDAARTYTGSWSNVASYGGHKLSSTAGNTASWTSTGTTFLMAVPRYDDGGDIEVRVDGGAPTTWSCLRTSANNPSGVASGAGLRMLTGLTNAAHTIQITVVGNGTARVGRSVGFTTIGSGRVYLGGPTPMSMAGYAEGSPDYDNGSAAAQTAWHSELDDVVTELAAAGLKVYRVNASVNTATQMQSDLIHINVSGNITLAQQFSDAMLFNHARFTAGSGSSAFSAGSGTSDFGP